MRWFLGLLLVIALVGGALYGVGRFILPNSLEVTRTAAIERPRASVFAMINDLRIAKEWSPFYARDPNADYAFSGDPGPGQTMRWVSTVREVGRGRMSIVDSAENEEVQAILQMGDRATLNSRIALRPGSGGTSVAWTVTAECGTGWINVPCRYMNLILRGMVQRELDSGLTRLKALAEQLPNVDFEGVDIVEVPVEPIDVIFVDLTIASDAAPTFADRASAESDGIGALNNFVSSQGGSVTRNGNEIVRVFPANNGVNGRYSFAIGYPYVGPAPQRLVGVRVGQTPTGAALRVEYVGRRSQIAMMYQRMSAYMQAHRISARPGTEAWEVVHSSTPPPADAPHPEDPIERTEIFFPIGS
jgi:carbon monoxide dehydrogenase subunit G